MISLKAYAKVNLSLEINGKRDDGYHILDTVMQTVSLYDKVTISVADSGVIDVSCDDLSLTGENNLCYKAATLFFEKVKINGGCSVNIEKNIPLSAGLGGGSSDAAAVLKGLNVLYNNPLSYDGLKNLALKLGADVPFLIKGGTARAKGIGEELSVIENKLPLYFVLIKEGQKPSTAQMYKKFDELGFSYSLEQISNNMEKSLNDADFSLFVDSLKNDFSCVWNYEKIKQDLINNGADAVSLSGSGPTVMGLFKDKNDAFKAFEKLKSYYSDIFFAESVNE